MSRQQILIVDDEEVNRAILSEIFCDDYEILEAGNGEDAIQQLKEHEDIVLVCLDVIMPVMDGFGVLDYMEKQDLLNRIPVILITGESVASSEGKAYGYGVADVMHKPFYPHIVMRRSNNIIELYQNKLNMERKLKEQEEKILSQEKKNRENNEFMIEALSTVVEFRSLETGDHIRRIKYFTKILLRYLIKNFPKYGLTPEKANEIVKASALHDIGKIGVSDAILLKPGRLTQEEFEVMKGHTTIGCEILKSFHKGAEEEDSFYQHCYDICRHHHERWDGNGYPDHLEGDEIPISAQVVAVADVYDALVSSRVYKNAYDKEVAYEMIMDGECGQFSPDILECLTLAKEELFQFVV